METRDIHTFIIELSGLYDNLNKCLQEDNCSSDLYRVFRQKEYQDVYGKLKNADIESLILGILANSLNEKILTRLRILIDVNIQIYQTRRKDFDNIDFYKVYSLQEEYLFSNKFTELLKDKEDIKNFSYPTNLEKEMLLKENQQETNQLKNQKAEYFITGAWIRENYYSKINKLSCSFFSIINSTFPVEKEKKEILRNNTILKGTEFISEILPEIEPGMIFRTRMFEKFLALERKLVTDTYLKQENLNKELNWISTHENRKPDIKRLVTFLTGLISNNYFLPNKDPKIKTFFESRYHITIGQNFERKRREPLLMEYKVVFHDYPF